MNTFVIDSSAWIEYFDGSELGKKVADIIDKDNTIITTTVITIAELSSFFRRKSKDFEKEYKIILNNSKIFYLDEDSAKEIGTVHAEIKLKNKKFSFADSVVLFAAKKLEAKVVTKDRDFIGFKEVILI